MNGKFHLFRSILLQPVIARFFYIIIGANANIPFDEVSNNHIENNYSYFSENYTSKVIDVKLVGQTVFSLKKKLGRDKNSLPSVYRVELRHNKSR